METGKRRISTVEANAAKAEEELAPEVVILVRPIARVEELALAIGPAAALEPEIGPVVAEQELDPVAAELALGPAVAVPVPSHQRDHLAAALRTKSVTAAHRRGLVPLLAAEVDLVVAAETTREPAAAEADTAWEAAGTAAAGAVVAEEVAAVVAAAVVAEDKQIISMREN
jgi:hypothetical protein